MNSEKEEMIPLADEETKSYEKQKVCYIYKKEFNTDDNDYDDDDDNKKYHKVRDHFHYTGKFKGAAHNICNLRYKIPNEITVVFDNGSTYDYHLIEELAKEIKGKLEYLGENTEKYVTFSVPIKQILIMVKQLRTN